MSYVPATRQSSGCSCLGHCPIYKEKVLLTSPAGVLGGSPKGWAHPLAKVDLGSRLDEGSHLCAVQQLFCYARLCALLVGSRNLTMTCKPSCIQHDSWVWPNLAAQAPYRVVRYQSLLIRPAARFCVVLVRQAG